MNPIESILGGQGDPVRCNALTHWFKSGAKVGDKCLCGKIVKEGKPKAVKKAK